MNVADRLDPVAFDNDISDDFDGAIENVSGIGLNKDSPRHPHSATGYLAVKDVLEAVRKVIGSTFEQEIGSFTIAKDLVGDLENAHRGDRHPTLIQLAREGQGNSGKPAQVRVIAELVKNKLTSIIEAAEMIPRTPSSTISDISSPPSSPDWRSKRWDHSSMTSNSSASGATPGNER